MNKEALEGIPCSACDCVDSQRHAANVVTAIMLLCGNCNFCVALSSGFKDSVESSKGVN